ncbi:hypothetical protein CPB85DRAFT_1256387 [Mucidula mucida]|nr:hypothetical protein CPB85DRAFT_1256387 [Mucidula mucida]
MLRVHLFAFLIASGLSQTRATATPSDWADLKAQVSGRLYEAVPFARSCFGGDAHNDTACALVQAGYDDATNRSSSANAYLNPQWESCQSSGAQCTLDYLDPTNAAAFSAPSTCEMGSIATHYIDVQSAEDVAVAFNFRENWNASGHQEYGRTQHDFIGRSSAPGSLALWTHNLKNITFNPNFVPQGSNAAPQTAMTMDAGVQWLQAYNFADAHNVTIFGGTDPTVGSVGGWVQGGGHSALSNTMGLGVDRVLEFKVVTPDGQTRIANTVNNPDLFWALRGGPTQSTGRPAKNLG